MSTNSGLTLGDSANLLFGFNPQWDRNDSSSKPIFAPKKKSTITLESDIPQRTREWGFPIVSIHDDVKSLINKLYDYKVLPAEFEEKTFSIPAGPLSF